MDSTYGMDEHGCDECHLPWHALCMFAIHPAPVGNSWDSGAGFRNHPKPACRSCPPGSQILETFEPEEEVTRRANVRGLEDRAKDRNGAG